MKWTFICLFTFLFLCGVAQNRLQFDRLDRFKGLENRSISSVVQDDLGFMWLGTADGLIRYDGYEIKLYKNNLKDKNSLGDNNIRALDKDKHGNLWIATQGGGLDKFDLRTEQFTHYRHADEDPSSISGNAVWSVFVDSRGWVWAGTWSDGLNVLNPETQKFKHIRENNYVPVLAIAEDDKGMIWFGSNGVNQLDPKNFNLQDFPDKTQGVNGIRSLFPDKEGNIWIATENTGLFLFDTNSKMYTRNSAITMNSNYTIYQDRNNRMWIGGDEGITILSSGDVEFYKYNPADKYSLSTNAIRTIYEDRIGNVWIGTEGGGVNRVLSKKNFQLFQRSESPGSLSHNLIRSLFEDSTGKIWVGTQGGGLNQFTPSIGQFKLIPIPSTQISSIYQDRDDTFWIGSWGSGLFVYNESKGVIKNFRHETNENSLPDDRIQVVHRDAKGVLWVGTENGLCQLDEVNGHWKQFNKANFNIELIGSNVQGQAFVESPDGSIWIGTWFGLNQISPDRKHITYFKADTSSAQYLSSDHVISLKHDQKNNALWIGTFGGGLNQLNLTNGSIRRFMEEDGFINNTIFGIKQDQDGNLWLSSNNGLSRYNPVSGDFRNYDVTEGLQGNEFYWGAALSTRDGKMLFGGINGLNVFNPSEIVDNTNVPPVVITGFEIFNRAVPVKKNSLLEQNINFIDQLILPYDQNVISFQYAALNYNSSEKNLYSCMLENFDKDWSSPSDRRSVSYTNLNPGEYTLRVKGSNNDRVWNEKGVSLKIIIVPPYWKTWWFYMTIGTTIIGLVYWVIHVRLRSVKRDKEQLRAALRKELDKVQSQLASEKKAVEEEQMKNMERNWIDQSLSIASEVFSKSKSDIDELCKEILSVLVKRCELTAAVMYLVESNSNNLKVQANYGFDCSHVTIPVGTGLTGECFEKREFIMIDSVPNNYFKISSGMGSAHPKYLMLTPLHYEEVCVGVIELASFSEIPEHQIQFIKRLSAQVTTTIHTAQISQQTGILLNESKQQMEELKVREEELKQNLEEMQSIQENHLRQQHDYEQIIKGLKEQLAHNA